MPEVYALCMTPWDNDGNLGRAYNRSMELLPDDGWAIFLDHDAMATTPHWHRQFQEAIAFQPEAGAFVAVTNRIASSWQRAPEAKNCDDVAYHRRIGELRRLQHRTLLDISGTKGFGGVFFAVSKRVWREVGGFADGLGCVDHSFHFGCQRVGRKVWLHEGIFAYHWRHNGEPDPTSQYPKAANCPCRGVEVAPSQRLQLP